MRRRGKRNTGRRGRKFSRRRPSDEVASVQFTPEPSITRKRASRRQADPGPTRVKRRENRVSRIAAAKRRSNRESDSGTQAMLRRLGDRRAPLRRKPSTKPRLQESLLPARHRNEDASSSKTGHRQCAQKKQKRRAVILAAGFGGRNNFRNYKEHRSCGT